jgi:prepilin-type N-terminal cleavage/methylation domain-containing protein
MNFLGSKFTVLHPRHTRRAPSRTPARGGFTLIEILVVIGVILILIGLFFGGMKKWTESSKRQITVTRIEMLQSALGELEAAGHNQFQQQWFFAPPNAAVFLDASQVGNVTNDIEPPPSTPPSKTIMVAGVPTTLGVDSRYNAMQYMIYPATTSAPPMPGASGGAPTAAYPQFGIMAKLMTLPTVAKAIAALPSSSIASATVKVGTVSVSYPVILDGWGNPILFVPSSGITNVYLNTNTNSWNPVPTVTAPDGRPFFVSAGPDGDFLKGDDNIYSFDPK